MNLADLAQILIRGEKCITFPLKHNAAGMVHDANGCHVLDIRGWGRIQYLGPEASQLHDAIADQVVIILNSWYEDHVARHPKTEESGIRGD